MNPKLPRLTRDVESSHLSPQQMQAIAMLLSGKSLTAVAEELRCSRKTLAKWKSANPHFIAAFNERKNEIFESANHRLQSLVAKVVLGYKCGHKNVESVKLKARKDVSNIEQAVYRRIQSDGR